MGQELLDGINVDAPAAMKKVSMPPPKKVTIYHSLADYTRRFDEPSKRKQDEVDVTNHWPITESSRPRISKPIPPDEVF